MFYCNRLAGKALGLFLLVALPLLLSAQVFTGEPRRFIHANLSEQFRAYEVYRLDATALKAYVHAHAGTAELQLGAHSWKLALTNSGIVAANYRRSVLTDHGLDVSYPTDVARPYQGHEVNGGGQVRLTLNDDFIYGFVYEGAEMIFIEPLRYLAPGAGADDFVVYRASDVIYDGKKSCGVEEIEQHMHPNDDDIKPGDDAQAESMACYQVELAIASDRSMFDKYGSVGSVESHNIAVMNDVEPNYAGSFVHDLQFVIVTQFVSTGTDPWTSSNNASTVLGSFTSWGQGGNFGVPFDLGQFWTNRDFDGSTVGIAWLSAVCTSQKYHALQDFTSNADILRVMTAHEIGHNFSCTHDANGCSNWIMCPTVSTATQWSPASITSVNNYLPGRISSGCITPCGPTDPPPTADFSFAPSPGCVGQSITFTDESTGNVTSRTWTFAGTAPTSGSGTTATRTWSTPGTFNVTLTATGPGGSNSSTQQVTILPTPSANFTSTVNGTTVTFNNTSTGSPTDYSWDFGDGENSFDASPVHTYQTGGIYTVVLTVSNSCGTATRTINVNTAPSAEFIANPTGGCASLSVQFTNQSSSNATSWSWQFPGGTPSSSNQKNPIVLYQNSGTFNVTLTAINGQGSTSVTQTGYINVQSVPGAAFTFASAGLTVTFTNGTSGATSYSWNFGDGETSTQANPVHTYATGGVYTVTLTTGNSCGTTTITKTVTLLAPPTAAFTASPSTGCAPLTVNYTNQSTGQPSTFAWSFPGGTPSSSSAANPTVVYSTPGTYSATLVASNVAGSNTSVQTNLITVSGGPTAVFTAAVNGAVATFTNTSAGATSYSWNFGDNTTSTSATPTHTYTADGTYTVTLTSTNACGTATATQTLTVVTPPTANFTATPQSGCGPLTVQYTSTGTPNATGYSWSFPGGSPSTSTAANPAVTYNTAGSYSVTLTVSNSAGTNTRVQNNYITVNAGPTAAFNATLNGATASFANTSTGAASYSWNFGDNTTSTAATPTHTYAANGTYTVTLTTSNNCGTATATQTLTVVTPPTAAFTANTTSGCTPFTVQFTGTGSPNATSYSWSFPGGSPATSNVANPTVTYNAAGTYSVTLTVSNSAGANTASQTDYITVGAGPSPAFTASVNGATASFANTTSGATSYSWNFGDNTTSTAATPSHTYAADGTYTVTLTASNACGTATATQTITVVTPPTAGFSASATTGCTPLQVQFANTSSANATTFAWQFPGGSPATSSAASPTVTYATPGTYSVTLVASNTAGGSTSTQSNLITVGTTPSTSFTSSVAGTTATFTNTSTGATSYSWNFGDGDTGTGANPSHTYSADGTYTVTLTATNACGSTTFSQPVVIVTSPTAGFTASTTQGCAPLQVQFTNLSSPNTTAWSWSFPGGTPSSSTLPNPVVTYTTPGTYSVTLVASTAAGSSTFSQSSLVTVLGGPTPAFTSAAAGSAVTFANSSQNATAYFWNFGDGTTSVEANPEHLYAADGTYTVQLTAINACDSITTSQTVTVATAPQADFDASTLQGCGPLTVAFTNASSANATSFAWVFEGATPSTSNEANPSATWSQPGTYGITLIAVNAQGSDTIESVVTVFEAPAASFTLQTVGLSVVPVNTSTSGGPTAYWWDFGDGSTSTEADPTHTYAIGGAYTVTLQVTNDCGVSTSTAVVEVAASAPQAQFGAENGTSGCAPFTIHFADQSLGAPTSWSWTFPGGQPGTSTAQNPTVTYASPGLYPVTLKVTNSFGVSTITVDSLVAVLSTPTAEFAFANGGGTVSFTNQSVNAMTYSWDFGDGTTSNEANPVHTYAATGSYTVQLTAVNACGASTIQQTVTVDVVGAGEATWLQNFRVYPNPNAGVFTVELNGEPASAIEFTLYNALGQQLIRENADFTSGSLRYTLRHGELPAATYTLRVRTGANTVYRSIVVQQ
jgi:PKD repeat protein